LEKSLFGLAKTGCGCLCMLRVGVIIEFASL
jgi:hypothetical protein